MATPRSKGADNVVSPGSAPRGVPGVSRRALLGGAAAGAAGATALSPAPAAAHSGPGRGRRRRRDSFVTVRHGEFRLDGAPFRFGGTNCYYLHQKSHYMIDSMLNDAAAMGISVVRAWAFADAAGDRALQTEPYTYDEDAFDSLDYAVHKAGELGIRLVLPLTNNWPDYGGMQQYVKWFLDLPDDTYEQETPHHDRFYTTESIKKCYRAYARHVIQRRNRYTGLRYNEDPTIMTFELANEPRCRSDRSGETLLAWVAEMSAWLKKLAPRQLIAVGDEGFYGETGHADYPYSDYDGTVWKQFVALPTVDYGTYHLYPQGWGEHEGNKPGTDPADWGARWIADHLADGRTLGKPVVLEEYGVHISAEEGIADTAARDAAYTAWTQAVEQGGGAGDQFWILTSRIDDGSFYPDYDRYRITWDNSESNAVRSTAKILSDHARAMTAASGKRR